MRTTHSRITAPAPPNRHKLRPAPAILYHGAQHHKGRSLLKLLTNVTLIIPVLLEVAAAIKRAVEAIGEITA